MGEIGISDLQPTRRQWFQFGVVTLLLLTTIVAWAIPVETRLGDT